MLQIVKSNPLHQQIYELLKKRLVQGEYQPGQRIVETKMAEDFQISRAPVREAIRMLIQDGLLEQRGNLVVVYQPDQKEIYDLFLCRQNLETLAARLASERVNTEQQEALLDIIQLTRKAWRADDALEVFELNTKFHHTVALASANQPLFQLINTIQAKVMYARNNIFDSLIKEDRFIEEHEKIANAIIQRDPALAELEMRRHLQHDLEVL